MVKFWTNETKLLIALARLENESINDEIQNLFNLIDWKEFLQLVVKNKLVLVVEKNLEEMAKKNLIDVEMHKEVMKFRFLANMLKYKVEIINREVEHMFKVFDDNNIKAVILKGISLERIYQHSNLRYYNDIDILIDSNDVEKVNNILISQEFVYIKNKGITGKELENISRQVFNCIGNYEKEKSNILLKIDLHKSDYYNTWNLQDFYSASIKDTKRYYCLNAVDNFIFTCYHAWHHYPNVVSIRLKTSQASLKHYMDIRESYLYLKRNGLLDKMYARIRVLGCKDVINNMLHLTERLYSDFCERNDIITCEETVENDCENTCLTSYFERRLFYPEVESVLVKKYYDDKAKASNHKEYIQCKFFNKDILGGFDSEMFWQENELYQSPEKVFYDEPYGTGIKKNKNYRFSFSLAWDFESLIIKIEIYDKQPFFGQEDYYNPIQDCIKFVFNDDWSEIFTLQIKTNGNHTMFIDKGDVHNLKKIHENVTYFQQKTESYIVITNIPWKYTKFSPANGEIIPFYFNNIIRNKELYCTDTIVFNDEKSGWIKLQ